MRNRIDLSEPEYEEFNKERLESMQVNSWGWDDPPDIDPIDLNYNGIEDYCITHTSGKQKKKKKKKKHKHKKECVTKLVNKHLYINVFSPEDVANVLIAIGSTYKKQVQEKSHKKPLQIEDWKEREG